MAASPALTRRASVSRSETSAQGRIHFARASKIANGVPAKPALRGAAAKMLEFEYAAILRDRLMELRKELK